MGITVISALPGGKAPSAASALAGSAENFGGAFASLLSGELLSQIGAVSGLGEAASKDAGGPPTPRELSDATLLASLFGHPANVDVAPRGIAIPPAALESASLPLETETRAVPEKPELTDARPRAGGVLDRAMKPAVSANADNLAALRAQTASAANAANIAGGDDADSAATPPPAHHFAAVLAARASENSAPTPAQQSVGAPLHAPAWPQQFGDRLVWLVRNEQQVAQLSINPPQLGPVQVSLNLSGGQVNIAFASPHPEVRQVIENAMPQLKEMLAAAGINLGQADIGANMSQQRGNMPFADANGTRLASENAILPANDKGTGTTGASVLQRGRGLVDLFA